MAQGIQDAIRRSTSDPSNIHEEGFFIGRDANGKTYLLWAVPGDPYAPGASALTMDFGPTPNIPGIQILAMFHDHVLPLPAQQTPSGRLLSDGSWSGDKGVANLRGLPGIIQTLDGTRYYYGPAMPRLPGPKG